MTRLTETALFPDDVRRASAFCRRLLGADPDGRLVELAQV